MQHRLILCLTAVEMLHPILDILAIHVVSIYISLNAKSKVQSHIQDTKVISTDFHKDNGDFDALLRVLHRPSKSHWWKT